MRPNATSMPHAAGLRRCRTNGSFLNRRGQSSMALRSNLSFTAMIEEQLTDSEKLKQQICDEILRKLKLQVDRVMRSSSSESEDN